MMTNWRAGKSLNFIIFLAWTTGKSGQSGPNDKRKKFPFFLSVHSCQLWNIRWCVICYLKTDNNNETFACVQFQVSHTHKTEWEFQLLLNFDRIFFSPDNWPCCFPGHFWWISYHTHLDMGFLPKHLLPAKKRQFQNCGNLPAKTAKFSLCDLYHKNC